jgi:hypothetical protein
MTFKPCAESEWKTVPGMQGEPWISTFTGKKFYVLSPRAEDVEIEDIAHALSMLCRYTGHVRQFYSVAQHSVYVSRICCELDSLWGLLHDAPEAYSGDMNAPLKHTPEMKRFRDTEDAIMKAVATRFGLFYAEPDSVKLADKRMLRTEMRDFMRPPFGSATTRYEPIEEILESWSPQRAEREFLERYYCLTGERVLANIVG